MFLMSWFVVCNCFCSVVVVFVTRVVVWWFCAYVFLRCFPRCVLSALVLMLPHVLLFCDCCVFSMFCRVVLFCCVFSAACCLMSLCVYLCMCWCYCVCRLFVFACVCLLLF